jgi:16S rRNA (adenine1518-N6/adenine1519-N6)-dimethyltransferase
VGGVFTAHNPKKGATILNAPFPGCTTICNKIDGIFVEMYTLKKSLGQHFLKDENIIRKIAAAVAEQPFSSLLEIGPGGGALTKELLKLPDVNFKAVELDTEKVNYLEQKYPELKGKILNQNFLKSEKPFEGSFTVVGNFPYNISTEILFKILGWKDDVPVVVGMFQKEVAQRLAAKEGNKTYGVISVLMQAYYNIEYLFDVGPQCFVPPPKVISGVIRLQRRKDIVDMKSDRSFTVLVKTAFNQRRKQLRNAVKSLFAEEVLKEEIFNKRAEALSVADFAALTFKMTV